MLRFPPFLLSLIPSVLLCERPVRAQPALAPDGNGVGVNILLQLNPGPILSPPPLLPVPVLPGSAVRFFLEGVPLVQIRDTIWSRNEVVLNPHSNELTLPSVNVSDTGRYTATVTTLAGDQIVSSRVLHVSEFPRQRLLNLSTRAVVSSLGPTMIAGFVVDMGPGDAGSSKQLLIRAVGPSLGDFGVQNALPDPVLTLFRSDGSVIETAPSVRDPDLIAKVGARTGAAALRRGAADTGMVISLRGGVYTAHVRSASNQTGDVLFEIYDVPR